MHYIIGSGPSGISCAYALLRQGRQVTLLDAGLELEAARSRQLVALQSIPPQQWGPHERAFLKEGMGADTRGIPVKLAYGSDFPYRGVAGATQISLGEASVATSYAQGGFSNVWGSAVLPYRQSDMEDWPIDGDRLARHYRSVFEFMPLAARRDGLERQFPLYAQNYAPLELSRQAAAMLRDMERHASSLAAKGVQYGGARIAVHARQNGHDCVHCGLCMYGCPYQLIYSTRTTLRQLQQSPDFHYVPGFQAKRVEERGDQVKISGNCLPGEAPQIFVGERVYLACGFLETTALLLRSLDEYDRAIPASDSQYFLLPLLRFRGMAGVRTESLHTLAQLFLEINDPTVSPYTVHLQTYTYNDLFEVAVRSALWGAGRILPTAGLLSRLLLFQGYLHSTQSGRLAIELRRQSSGEDLLHVSATERPETKRQISALIRKLFSMAGDLRGVPLPSQLRVGAPGRGFHGGGSLPMRRRPQGLETDVFGRPAGLRRIHAVDSSIFPSIPATTITLTAMANAHRIGDEWELYA
jgi:choline dehydrogenase-like flavoprotein